VYTKAGVAWNMQEACQVFARELANFQLELRFAEERFAPLRQAGQEKAVDVCLANLCRIDGAAEHGDESTFLNARSSTFCAGGIVREE